MTAASFKTYRHFCYALMLFSAILISDMVAGAGIPHYHFYPVEQTDYYGGIHSISKDSEGRMWFSGQYSVYAFDGDHFVSRVSQITSLAPKDNWNFDNIVSGPNESMFIGSNHGLVKYDGSTQEFYIVAKGNIGSLTLGRDGLLWMVSDGKIISVSAKDGSVSEACGIESSSELNRSRLALFNKGEGTLFASDGKTLLQYDPKCGIFKKFLLNDRMGGATIKDALESEGMVYILTEEKGIFSYDKSSERITRLNDGAELRGVKHLYMDKYAHLWVCSQSGLFIYDTLTGESGLETFAMGDSQSIQVNSVWAFYGEEDGSGVWISTYGGRIAYTDLSESDNHYYEANAIGLPYPIVSCFAKDVEGRMWIGTEGGGIAIMDADGRRIEKLDSKNGLLSDYVKYIECTPEGEMLVSTFNGGIQMYDKKLKRFTKRGLPPYSRSTSAYRVVRAKDGGLFLTSPDQQILYMDPKGELTPIVFSGSQNINSVNDIFRNADGNLIIINSKGLFVVDEAGMRVKDVIRMDSDIYADNNLLCYCRLANGDVVLGTDGAGINILHRDGRYRKLDSADGSNLDGKTVCGILQDDATSNLWISTTDSFYEYDFTTRSYIPYNSLKFKGAGYLRSCCKDETGRMYFGGTDGFVSFTPSTLVSNDRAPKVFITEIRLNQEQLKDKSQLRKLKHYSSVLEISFACDNYVAKENNIYAYRLQGLRGSDWMVLPKGQRRVQFANLSPGRYTLYLKASNNSGLWGEEKLAMHFRVHPAAWASRWAILIYVIVVGALIFLYIHFATNKKVLEQELELEKTKAESERQLMVARTKFLTNISHDLKTPLMLLEDPLKKLKEHTPEDSALEKYIASIDRNAHRISHMISQLLQFREIESQRVILNNQTGDFVRFASDIFSLFEPFASQKGIEMVFKSQHPSLMMSFDWNVIEKVLSNLCSNAIKYTVDDGFVGMNISNDENTVHISVVNTGTGIPEEKKAFIFNEFAKLPGQHPNFQSSTGLGLAIVKELVNVLEGTIELHSSDSRVEFAVTIPFVQPAPGGFETETEYDYASSEVDTLFVESAHKSRNSNSSRKADTVLVVEDDPALRSFMETNLSDRFNVYTAANGADGLAKADKTNPKVIISDLMMPEMDGFELCRQIRNDIRISHIPVIVTSGLEGREAKLKAMEAGASVFLEKPVDIAVLVSQIEGLIRSHEEMRQLFSKKYVVEPAKVVISSMDEKILGKAMSYIEKNMDNFDYDVESFVSDMAIGRTVLYRKINDITGMSIKEFIMDMRLKRAMQLMKESDFNISEISMMTGFINPKYFSVCFKRRYGKTPSEFKILLSAKS